MQLVRPVRGWYLPRGQLKHPSCALQRLNCPAMQVAHVWRRAACFPAGQSWHSAAPAGANRPLVQASQCRALKVALNRPTSQGRQREKRCERGSR